ncbi:unnamed protein product [Paramecium sonneborni]|uniref:RBR-type E3 ubiquitin transferase n=1 Tax=Paramecium sonneborni TaxID=65129 RepID=A0A8S1L5P5_9CILI|nr:unnamed protein product [Paramecium sonneborni]
MNKMCQICYDLQNVVTIECGHNYCKNCLNNIFFKNELLDLENFICPLENCKRKLTDKTLKLFIEDYEKKYETFLQQGIIFGLNENEKLITCLNINCNSQFVIWKEAETLKCQNCKLEFCLRCKLAKHEGQNCIQALRLNQVMKTRVDFLKSVKNSQAQQICPHCLYVIERNKGCNFMTCQSKSCNSKKYFCFQCGVALENSESKSHYKDENSFHGQCKIKINGIWVEKDKIPNNDIPCPKCQCQDPLKSKIERNLLICKSEQCIDKIYCIICQFELNDKIILKHLENHVKKSDGKKKSRFGIFDLFKKYIK